MATVRRAPLLALLALAWATPVAAQQTYDAFAGFSAFSNPTVFGSWSYGFTRGLGGSFTVYTNRFQRNSLSHWAPPSRTTPNVVKNETGDDITVAGALFLATDVLELFPGPNSDFSVVRWTVPQTAQYQVAGGFVGLRVAAPMTTTTVHVLHNNAALYGSRVDAANLSRFFSVTVNAVAGDKIDFAVGNDGVASFDNTGLKAVIVRLVADSDGDGVADNLDNCASVSNPDQADADFDSLGNACDACPEDPHNDQDGDGVCGNVDMCADTSIPESAARLRLNPNHFALVDGDATFESGSIGGKPAKSSYTLDDTAGCSCEQIVAAMGLGRGQLKQGCSPGTMKDWTGALTE